MLNRNDIEQFMTVSYFYLLLTEKTSAELSRSEVEELIIAVYDSSRWNNPPPALMQ